MDLTADKRPLLGSFSTANGYFAFKKGNTFVKSFD
jgi:hypothetical protein